MRHSSPHDFAHHAIHVVCFSCWFFLFVLHQIFLRLNIERGCSLSGAIATVKCGTVFGSDSSQSANVSDLAVHVDKNEVLSAVATLNEFVGDLPVWSFTEGTIRPTS